MSSEKEYASAHNLANQNKQRYNQEEADRHQVALGVKYGFVKPEHANKTPQELLAIKYGFDKPEIEETKDTTLAQRYQKSKDKNPDKLVTSVGNPSTSVGEGLLLNYSKDVAWIQEKLLNLGILSDASYAAEKATGDDYIGSDAIPQTIQAIITYQKEVLAYGSTDGQVTAGGKMETSIGLANLDTVNKKREEYKKGLEAKEKAEKEEEFILKIKNTPSTNESVGDFFNNASLVSVPYLVHDLAPYMNHNPEFFKAVLNHAKFTDTNAYDVVNHLNDAQLNGFSNDIKSQLKSKLTNGLGFALNAEYQEQLGRIEGGNIEQITQKKNTELKSEKDATSTNVKYAYWKGIKVYESSGGKVKQEVVDNKKVDVLLDNKLTNAYVEAETSGDYSKLTLNGEEIGWVESAELLNQDDKDRISYFDEYKTWLGERYDEVESLKGQAKLDRVKGVLSQAELVIKKYQDKDKELISELEKQPSFNDDNKGIDCPHELIGSLREWVELTEKTIDGVTKETGDNANAGSLYSDIDWNTRLKVPQYRTQSDNLIAPEVTCAPTTFAMMAERAGWSREDLITAIEKKFTNDSLTDMDDAWKTKGKAFFTFINKGTGSKNYKKVRAGDNGKIKSDKFEDLAKEFKSIGQYEDLLYFYHYLIDSDGARGEINSGKNQNDKLRSGLENDGNTSGSKSHEYKQIDVKKWSNDLRNQVKGFLDKGFPVMFSIFHKGPKSSLTHNHSVQGMNSEGIIIDDPFGKINPEYRRNGTTYMDLFKDKGATNTLKDGRSKYDFKNVPNYNASETDYSKRDFTSDSAHKLIEKENRGNSTLLTWEMLVNSKKTILNYIVIWEK